jgi:GDP-fucose transporter C1
VVASGLQYHNIDLSSVAHCSLFWRDHYPGICAFGLLLYARSLSLTCAQSPFVLEPKLWWAIGATGVAGFLINVAVFLQIKHTSPLTNNISGTAKAALQTVVAVLVFGDAITGLNVMGIALVMTGSALYSHVKLSEMRATRPASV